MNRLHETKGRYSTGSPQVTIIQWPFKITALHNEGT